jgi:hypothetical protein
MSVAFTPDYAAVNALGMKYNRNVDWSAQYCVAGTPPPPDAPEAKGDSKTSR